MVAMLRGALESGAKNSLLGNLAHATVDPLVILQLMQLYLNLPL